jgi:mono/diheme cytochrome c family protein
LSADRRVLWIVGVALAALLGGGCRQQMANQPRYVPLEASAFFGDGRSARPVEPGTVARGQLEDDPHLYAGRKSWPNADATPAAYADTFPMAVDGALLRRGQERYGIFCAMCHGKLGYGDGKIVQRGFTPPPSYHGDLARGLKDTRLRDAPVGYYFEVITNGHGAMASYATQVKVADRWAIVAYIRALQLSQDAPADQLTEEERRKAEGGPGS